MKNKVLLFLTLVVIVIAHSHSAFSQVQYSQQWPSFRGPWARGYIENSKTPVHWSIDSLVNVKWKITVPGLGHSCPIIWNNFVFVTTAASIIGNESLKVGLYGDIDEANDSAVHEFKVYCIDKNNGKVLWERVAHRGIPKSKRHTKASQANSTPATDGEYLVVHFGSEGLYCFNLKGELIWKKDMGILNPGPYTDPGVEWGYASSPIIHKGKIIVQCDIPITPYIAALELKTGKELWRTSRKDEVSTWCTPTIYEDKNTTLVVANGFKQICGYSFDSGKEIWRLSNGGDAPAPTPVVANNLIYLNSAHGKFSPIFVVKPESTGDITLHADSTKSKNILWSIKRGGAYMQTPLIYRGLLYNLQVNGTLTCFDALTGEVIYKENLKEAFSASGIAADGKLYFSSEEGNIYVIKAGPEFELLAKNAMKDVIMATPAISDNIIFFRTQHHLIAVE